MARQIPYLEQLHVETQVDQGYDPNRLAEANITNGLEYIEVAHGQILVDMIQGYTQGRKEFQALRVAAAYELADEKPAEAIVAARLALDIPDRSGEIDIMQRNELIVAMDMVGPLETLPGPFQLPSALGDGYQQAYWRQAGLAKDAAFGTPEKIKKDLEEIVDKSRERIADDEVDTWITAINTMGETGDLHGAGQGAIELGVAYERQGDVDEAVLAYGAACGILKARLGKIVAEQEPIHHAAEMDELILSIRSTQRDVVRLLSEKRRVKGTERELLKAAVYDFDDFGAPPEAVADGYRLLAKSSRSLWQKFFFRREAAEIRDELALDDFILKRGGGWTSHEDRKDHTHLRPRIKLAA